MLIPASLRRGRGELSRARLGIALVAAAAAFAFAAQADAATVEFQYTGGSQTWTVPDGVTSATFDLYGASGALNILGGGTAGGGRAMATIPVTPGETLQINVGQAGRGGPVGAFGGGGVAGTFDYNGGSISYGAGGGGASDVRTGAYGLADRILVAGGGGGGGFGSCGGVDPYPHGGGGGGLLGGDAFDPCGTGGGDGGTQSAGGLSTGNGTTGTFGAGGTGGSAAGQNATGGGGGGGGGGWYGGGGGGATNGANAAGGGGSGHGPPGTIFETGVRDGDGHVTITYADPPPPPDDPPRIERLAVNPRSFVASSSATPLTRRAGAKIEIVLSEDAVVRFRVRCDPRRRDGGPPPRKARTFSRELPSGESTIDFTGTMDGRTFRPGRYTLVARARDSAGQRSEKASAGFRILAR